MGVFFRACIPICKVCYFFSYAYFTLSQFSLTDHLNNGSCFDIQWTIKLSPIGYLFMKLCGGTNCITITTFLYWITGNALRTFTNEDFIYYSVFRTFTFQFDPNVMDFFGGKKIDSLLSFDLRVTIRVFVTTADSMFAEWFFCKTILHIFCM